MEMARGLDPYRPSDVARLRKHCSAEQSRAVLELVELRGRATAKFARAAQMFFDRVGYEQASGEVVADYKADRIRLLYGGEDLLDLCCGIGGDAIALAGIGPVTAVDRSPVRVRMTELNLRVYGREQNARLLAADVETARLPKGIFHLDPDRRSTARSRTLKLEELQPGKEYIDRLLAANPDGVIKLSPGTEYTNLPWDGEIELISHKGQCRQLLVWTGRLAAAKLKATVLPSGCALTDEMPVAFDVREIGSYLYDPDPAVSRLRLLGQLAAELGLSFLAPGQIVLSADELIVHPMAAAYRVEEIMPYHEAKVRKFFKEAKVGPVTVKPRGADVHADKLSRLFSGRSGPEKVLFILRLDKRLVAVVTGPKETLPK